MRHSRRRQRRLNTKLVIALPVAAVLLAGGVYLVHGMRLSRTAAVMFDKATEAEHLAEEMAKKGEEAKQRRELEKAAKYYGYYFRYRSDDVEAFTRYALLLAEIGDRPDSGLRAKKQALTALAMASTQNPDNEEVLRRLADYNMRLGRAKDAERILQLLRQRFPDEAELGAKLARCQVRTEHFVEALGTLQEVIALDRHHIEAYEMLANLLRDPRLGEAEQAEAWLERMIKENGDSAGAYLARARYRRRDKALALAREDVETARSKAPKSLPVLLALADQAVAEGEYDEAMKSLDRARSLYPDDERVYKKRAAVNQQRDPEQAEDDLKKIKDPAALRSLVTIQIRNGNVAAARETLGKMKKVGYPPRFIKFYEAQILIVQRQWRKASYEFERLRPEMGRDPAYGNQIDMLLGICYRQLGLPDRQLVVYQRLLDDDSTLVPARVGYASALLRTGQTDRAIAEFYKLRDKEDLAKYLGNTLVRNGIFQLMLAAVMRTPEADRDWSELEQFVAAMEERQGVDRIQLAAIKADLMVKKGEPEQARRLLQSLCDKNPDHVGLWSTLVTLTAMTDGPREAMAALEKTKGRLGNVLSLRLLEAALAPQLGRKEGVKTLAALAAGAADLQGPAKAQLLKRVGIGYYRLGQREKAAEVWGQVADSGVDDPRIQQALFELARESGNVEGMAKALEALRKQLGTRSAEWNYCEAARLVWMIRQGKLDRNSLKRAKQHLREAKLFRIKWYKILRLEGEIALMEGRQDDAVVRYREASELGPLGAKYLHQLVQLLYSRGEFEEAKELLDKLGTTTGSTTMDRLRIELDERTGELEQALELAAEMVRDSQKATDFLWYGQLLARSKKPDEAERAFRRAVELEPRLSQGWLMLVAVLVDGGKKDEAEQVVRDAESQLPEDVTSVVLAQCYAKLGQVDRAERHYLDALSRRPGNLAMIGRVALFYLQSRQPEKAAKYLGEMIQIAGQDPKKYRRQLVWARRSLAEVLAGGNDYRRHGQALRLLDENAGGKEADVADLRLKAAILARRPDRRSRKAAIEILEGLRKKLDEENSTLSFDQQIMLAGLYDSTNRWTQCNRQMLDLLIRKKKDPALLATYLRMLFRHGALGADVKPWLRKLEQLEPDAPVTVEMKARLLIRENKNDEAVALLKTLIPRPVPPDQVGKLRNVASLLEELKQHDAAKELLVEFAEKAPGGSILLAGFLGRHGTIDEALDQCEVAAKDIPWEEVLPVATNVLRGRNRVEPTPEQIRRVETWVNRVLDENPRSRTAQLQRIRILDLQGRHDELVKSYRSFLARDDLSDRDRALVWNNLAFVLAAREGKGREALEMVNKAVAILGPVANLLDTRAMAYLALDRNKLALDALREAISDTPSGVRYFHLALARAAAGDLSAAAKALEMARDSHQLSEKDIPLIERRKYRQLLKKLDNI